MTGVCWRCEDGGVMLDGHGLCPECAVYHEQDWDEALAFGTEIAAYERSKR